MKLNEPMEFTMTIDDADLEVMAKILKDIKIPECPYFDISDKYGNKARYYRENRWIPCSEGLPKQGQEVICQCRASIIKVLKLDANGDWYQDANHCYMGGFVIAWMPLPSPYQEEGEKEWHG
jgi:hypothetical protein